MKILFLTDNRKGSVEAIKWLNKKHNIICCVYDNTGEIRGLREVCLQNNIPVTESTEIYLRIDDFEKPDLIVSYLFRHKIQPELIEQAPINRYGYRNIINFHPAPLPDAKGVGMSSQAIIQGFTEWGVTAHYVNEQFDDGDIIDVRRFQIPEKSTSIELQLITQLEQLKLLKETITKFESGGAKGYKQEKEGKYFSNKLLQSYKCITGKEKREELDQRVHGLFYPPYDGAYIVIDDKKYTLIDEEILKKISELYRQYENDLFENT